MRFIGFHQMRRRRVARLTGGDGGRRLRGRRPLDFPVGVHTIPRTSMRPLFIFSAVWALLTFPFGGANAPASYLGRLNPGSVLTWQSVPVTHADEATPQAADIRSGNREVPEPGPAISCLLGLGLIAMGAARTWSRDCRPRRRPRRFAANLAPSRWRCRNALRRYVDGAARQGIEPKNA